MLRWENRGLQPVKVLSAVIFDQDHDPITRAEDYPRFEDAFTGSVVDRVVIKGVNTFGEPTRIVVRDRSGRLLGVREPTACESDWAWAGSLGAATDIDDIALVAAPPYARGTSLMVGCWSFPCGPDVIVDVDADLRVIKVIERYHGGRDALRSQAPPLHPGGKCGQPTDEHARPTEVLLRARRSSTDIGMLAGPFVRVDTLGRGLIP